MTDGCGVNEEDKVEENSITRDDIPPVSEFRSCDESFFSFIISFSGRARVT
jgi:hypothetical protein